MPEPVIDGGAAAPAATAAVPSPAGTPVASAAPVPAGTSAATTTPAVVPAAVPPPAVKVEPQVPAAQPPAPAKADAVTPLAAVEIELKLPAGAKYDDAALKDFKAVFSNEKLTPAQRAQAVIDLDQKYAAQAQKAFQTQVEQQRTKDIDALKADKEFGGSRFDKTVADAKSAAKQFGGEEFSKLAEAAGLDVHPAFVKTFARIRAALSEDTTSQRVPGSQATDPAKQPVTSQKQRLAQRYQKQPQK